MSPQLVVQRVEYVLHRDPNADPTDLRMVEVCREYFPDPDLEVAYSLFFYIVLYLVPLTTMFITYGRIVHRLWTRRQIGESLPAVGRQLRRSLREKRRIVRMLIVIVAVFVLGWTPFFTCHVYQIFYGRPDDHVVLEAFLQLFGYSTSCINPFVYCFLNDSFQRQLCATVVRCSAVRRLRGAGAAGVIPDTTGAIELHGNISSLTRHNYVIEQHEHCSSGTIATVM